jgi:RNA polymerase sigma-70 factor (family 1)
MLIMSSSSTYNDQELLARIAAGDEESFTLIYKKYSATIFQVAMKYTRQDIQQSEELVQEIFIRIWEKRNLLAEVGSADNYLFIVARNFIFDSLKKQARELTLKRNIAIESIGSENDIEKYIDEKQNSEVFRNAIDSLPEQQRKVYTLFKEQGLTQGQIAAELNLSIETVRTHMKLANRALRKYFEEYRTPEMLLLIFLITFFNS